MKTLTTISVDTAQKPDVDFAHISVLGEALGYTIAALHQEGEVFLATTRHGVEGLLKGMYCGLEFDSMDEVESFVTRCLHNLGLSGLRYVQAPMKELIEEALEAFVGGDAYEAQSQLAVFLLNQALSSFDLFSSFLIMSLSGDDEEDTALLVKTLVDFDAAQKAVTAGDDLASLSLNQRHLLAFECMFDTLSPRSHLQISAKHSILLEVGPITKADISKLELSSVFQSGSTKNIYEYSLDYAVYQMLEGEPLDYIEHGTETMSAETERQMWRRFPEQMMKLKSQYDYENSMIDCG